MKSPSPVYTSSRKEMWAVFGIWLVFCVWVVGYCQLRAYSAPGEDFATVFGLPEWVFFGVAVPWCVATTVTIVFALYFVKDHSLDADEHSGGDVLPPRKTRATDV